MAGDIRSLLRAAQDAEGRREPLEAAGHLQRAATLLEESGRPARAAQLLRHAVRLSPDAGRSRQLEALERTLAAEGPTPSDVGGRVYLLDDDASLAPAPSAFTGEEPVGLAADAELPARRSEAGAGGLLLAHHIPVLAQVEVALAEGQRMVLLLGPQGSGRSTCLSALAARLGGAIIGPPFTAGFPPVELLLLDDAHRLDGEGWASLERLLKTRRSTRIVLAAPKTGASLAPALVATSEAGEVPLWTTAELLEAAPTLLPSLAGRVDRVVEVSLPRPEQLERLARELLLTHRPGLVGVEEVASLLADQATTSPRGLHELISLVHRLPASVRSVRRVAEMRGGSVRRASGRGATVRGSQAPAKRRKVGEVARKAMTPPKKAAGWGNGRATTGSASSKRTSGAKADAATTRGVSGLKAGASSKRSASGLKADASSKRSASGAKVVGAAPKRRPSAAKADRALSTRASSSTTRSRPAPTRKEPATADRKRKG